ncbi:MAG: amidohydrolase family protein, partial [Candidatus Latescibacterota bacterium]
MRSRLFLNLVVMNVLAIVCLAAGAAGEQTENAPAADLVLTGGIVHTMNETAPRAEAVGIANGRIIFVGASSDIEPFVTSSTRRIDLAGSTVFPGFVDAHAHLDGLGKLLVQVNVNGTTSARAVKDRVVEWQSKTPPGSWIQGRGWDQNDWDIKEFPTWRDLI